MNLNTFLGYFKNIGTLIPFNLFDVVIVIFLALYTFEDASFGLIAAGTGFISLLIAFFVGLFLYRPLSGLIVENFSMTKGISDAIAFLLVTAISFFITSLVLTLIRRRYISVTVPRKVDLIGGGIFGVLSFFIISSFVVTLLLSFPVSGMVKGSIRDSVTGKYFYSQTQGMERYVRQIFGGAIDDTINFLTITPTSDDTLPLNFKTNEYQVDRVTEKKMLALVNQERQKNGLRPVVFNEELAQVARLHAGDMLRKGYFSHYSTEGFSPFDRMEKVGVVYTFAGENLAFAPDVVIAMNGLMKSPGHRANILSSNYGELGIGVLDAGIFGKMFVQEFKD